MKLPLFAPELVLLLGGLVLFLISAGKSDGRTARKASIGVALGAALASALTLCGQGLLFYGTYRIDLFSQTLKLAMALGYAVVLVFSTQLKGIRSEVRAEYYFFLLSSVLGLFMLVSSVELITMFIALELSSYSLYLLVPMRDDQGGLRMQMESAIKYILFGVVATGVMLFGMSYMFGLTGTTFFVKLMPALKAMMGTPAAVVAVAMVLGGFFFKLAVFPFHFWVPDVYQGASNETTAFIASVPKIAAVALLARVAAMAGDGEQTLSTLLVLLALCSMFYGNLVALVQTDIKRMLGFSGIAHAGYAMIGFVAFQQSGYATSLYYVTGYMAMTLAGFLVICTVSARGDNLAITDLSGLYKRSPLLAFILGVSMFALAGIPPFAGFMGKFLLLTGAYKAGFLALVILAAINTAISIYYYLSVVRVVYSGEAEDGSALSVGPAAKMVGLALVAVILWLGLAPDAVMRLAADAVRSML